MSHRYPRYRRWAVLCVWAALSGGALAQDSWTLDQLLNAAWDSHPAVLGKRSGVQAAQGDLDGARWQRFPTPSLESSIGRGGESATVLRIDQPLWTGGRISAAIHAADRRVTSADAQVMQAQHDLALKVIAAWVEAQRQQTRQDYAATSVKVHEKLLAMISRRVAQEVSPAVDRNFAQVRLLQASNELSVVTQSLQTALTQLSQLAGRPVLKAGGVLGAALETPRDTAIAQALDYAPALKRLSAEEEAAAADIDAKKSSLWPQLTLRAESSTGSQANSTLMLVLTAQPGAGLSAPAGVDAAVARREAVRMEREAAVREVQELVSMDWDDLNASRIRLENARQSRAMSAEVFDSYTRQYTTGRKTWIDVLNAVRETTQADLALADAVAQAGAAALRLRLRTGQMQPGALSHTPLTPLTPLTRIP